MRHFLRWILILANTVAVKKCEVELNPCHLGKIMDYEFIAGYFLL